MLGGRTIPTDCAHTWRSVAIRIVLLTLFAFTDACASTYWLPPNSVRNLERASSGDGAPRSDEILACRSDETLVGIREPSLERRSV